MYKNSMFGKSTLTLLTGKKGEANEQKILSDCASIGEEIGKLNNAGFSTIESIEVLKLMELRIISNCLESVNSNLSEIAVSLESLEKDIDGCISVSGKSQYLCITGDVTTY